MSCASCQFGSSFAAVTSASPTIRRSGRRRPTCLLKRVSSFNSAARSAPPTRTSSVPNSFTAEIGPRPRTIRDADSTGLRGLIPSTSPNSGRRWGGCGIARMSTADLLADQSDSISPACRMPDACDGTAESAGLQYALVASWSRPVVNELPRGIRSALPDEPGPRLVALHPGAYLASAKPVGCVWNSLSMWGSAAWTRDGKLRHPRYISLRTVKEAREVVRE